MRVLVADDDRAFRGTLKRVMETRHFRIWEAGDGEEAVEFSRSLRPDLIMMDLSMPRMDGGGDPDHQGGAARRAHRRLFGTQRAGLSSGGEPERRRRIRCQIAVLLGIGLSGESGQEHQATGRRMAVPAKSRVGRVDRAPQPGAQEVHSCITSQRTRSEMNIPGARSACESYALVRRMLRDGLSHHLRGDWYSPKASGTIV